MLVSGAVLQKYVQDTFKEFLGQWKQEVSKEDGKKPFQRRRFSHMLDKTT